MLNTPRPLRVVLVCSHRIPGLEDLLNDPRRGSRFEIAGCVTSDETFEGRDELERHGIQVVSNPIHAFHRDRNLPLRNLRVREDYDALTAEVLRSFDPDLVALTSYRYILTSPVLGPFEGRIINIHDGDLTIVDEMGVPKFMGLHAVREAIFEGAHETRATVHYVTDQVCRGPLLLQSDPYPVASALVSDAMSRCAFDVLKAYAFAHREWMIRSAWGPLLGRAFELIATGCVHVTGGVAWVEGMPGPCRFHDQTRCEQRHESSNGTPPGWCPFITPEGPWRQEA